MDYKEQGASELDKLCHRIYDYQKQNGFKVSGECHRCGGPLSAYYCEERLYLIACEECGTIVLTKACSPQVAANLTIVEKDANEHNLRVSKILARAEAAEDRVRNLEKLLSAVHNMEKFYPDKNGFFVFTKKEADEITGKLVAAEARAEKAERERDAAISDLTYIARTYPVDLCDDLVCQYCKHYQNVNTGCPGWTENDCFEWRGKKEE